MTYPEEGYARDLYAELAAIPNATSSIEGAGVHWCCTITDGGRACSIDCFDMREQAQYCITYRAADQVMAIGRTGSKQEVHASVRLWLSLHSAQSLYDRFAFVDQNRRALERIRDGVLGAYPVIGQTALIELRAPMREFEELWFSTGNRACRATAFHPGENPRLGFLWDGTPLFCVNGQQVDPMASMIRRWLIDGAMPSAMADEFAEVKIGRLAAYYESGKGIEGEFILSWEGVEGFYRQVARGEFSSAILMMMAAMRGKGYDRLLRAGTSMWTLVLSRSRHHGLSSGQPSIGLFFRPDGMVVHSRGLGAAELRVPETRFTPEVEDLLRRLAEMPID